MRLFNKVALVTGAGRGIGAAIAQKMAAEGARLVLVSRTLEQLESQRQRIIDAGGPPAQAMAVDVSQHAAVTAMIEAVLERWGRIDVLVNAAGNSVAGPSETLALDDWRRCLATNLDGTFFCCQAVGAHMIARAKSGDAGGKIINITSLVAHAAIPERAAYAASKGGVKQLSQNLAVEWAPYGIQVNTISPGFILTEIVRDYIARGIHQPERMVARIPAGRMGEVEDVAGPAVFLASSESDYVTGTTLIVDGGWMANGYV
jgi:NAD(P)-dependent dehydrogenase (short-subunit alcohol dehydrogenase family)